MGILVRGRFRLEARGGAVEGSCSAPSPRHQFGAVFRAPRGGPPRQRAGTYMGSVNWGWAVDGKGVFSGVIPTLKSKGNPSAEFKAAAQMWDKATTAGTIKTTANPTEVFSSAYVKNTLFRRTPRLNRFAASISMTMLSITMPRSSPVYTRTTVVGLQSSDLADVGGGQSVDEGAARSIIDEVAVASCHGCPRGPR